MNGVTKNYHLRVHLLVMWAVCVMKDMLWIKMTTALNEKTVQVSFFNLCSASQVKMLFKIAYYIG